MKAKFLFLLLSVIVPFTGSCQHEVAPSASRKILFVGNSLTYTNDLPALVVREAKRKGTAVKADMLAYPNYALEDHWIDGELQQKIEKEKYEFVIVQQGPSSQADGLEMLLTYGEKISDLCRKHDTKLVFFMVWPARANFHTFGGVIANYTDAATSTGSILCPVGKVWKEHFDATKDFSYYGPDGFHPSLAGSENAATLLVNELFKSFRVTR